MKKTLQLDFSNKASNVTINSGVVTKIWGDGLGWTLQEAKEVLADHTQYLENLKSVNIQTSEILSRTIFQNQDGNYLIKEEETYAGEDVSATLLNTPDIDALLATIANDFRLSARLLTSIPPREGGIYSNDYPWSSVPVDLKPQNIIINDGSTLKVIDSFGPKLWLEGKIKPLPTHVPGRGQILNDEIKVGDVRFALGRLNGYFIALATRWFATKQPDSSIEEIDELRSKVSDVLIKATEELLTGNDLFEKTYAQLLISDASEKELQSIKYGSYEGPRYVQELYEHEEVPLARS